MADKDLTLRMRLDKTGADASAQQFHAAELARVARLRDAHGRATKQGTEDVLKHQAAVGEMGGAVDKAGAKIGRMMAGYATVGVALGGVRLLAEAWAAVEANTLKTGLAALEYEKQTRALAALQNIDKPSAAVAGALDFAVKSGLPLAQADVYQQAFLGSSPAGVQKGNVDEKTLEKFKVESAVMASRQGTDLKVRGDLAGILGQFKKYKEGDEGVLEMLGDMEKIRQGLTEGRGEDAPLTASLLHVAGSIVKQGGMVEDLPEMAAQIGVASLGAGALGSDVRTEQVAKGLRGSTKKDMSFLKKWAGVGEHDTMEQRLAKVIPKLREERDVRGRDMTAFLVETGAFDQMEAKALTEMEGVYEVYQKRLAKSRQAGVGAEVRKANEEFQKSAGGRMDIAKTSGEAADVAMGKKNMDWTQVQTMAESEWKMSGKDENLATWVNNAVLGLTRFAGPTEGRKRRIGMLALQKMREQVRGAGLSMTEEQEGEGLEEKGRNIAAFLRKHDIVPGANMTAVSNGINRLVGIEEEKKRERGNEAPKPIPGGKPIQVGRSN